MKKEILKAGKLIYHKYPSLRPILAYVHKKFIIKPRFIGWGMTTEHELPWNDEYSSIFLKANSDVKNNFEFTKDTAFINSKNLDTLRWRHWIVSYAVRHAIIFSTNVELNCVECGVGDGITAFFALREISGGQKNISYTMHLYDSWDAMRKEELLDSEIMERLGKYSNLNINITKKNLAEFTDHIIYHIGYIPNSFTSLPESPKSIQYLHIDLNSANPTLATLEFFFPRLTKGGVILFDDYGWAGYEDTAKVIDIFFHNKPGILMKLPTGQAIYYR